jgi:hypothetical protein
MTAGALTFDKSHADSPKRLRTIGEFLITGGATLILIPFAYFYRKIAGLEDSEYFVSFLAFYAAYLINDPHFGVSYLLFYKNAKGRLNGTEFQGAQRIRYIIAGFVVPIVLAAWIAFAMIQAEAAILGAMVQLMFFLVGWHYVKQGFGVLMVISARRGTFFSSQERFLLLLHCFSGWAYAWLSPRERGGSYEESGVVYTAMAHPAGLEKLALVLFIVSTVALAYGIFVRIRNKQPFPPLSGASGFFMSIWLWTVFSSFDPLIAYVIPGLHSLQYWYFVYLLKNNEVMSQASEVQMNTGKLARLTTVFGPIYGRLTLYFLTAVALSWLAFNGVPNLLDDTVVATTAKLGDNPEISSIGLGATPYLAAFATFINIHHYFMDHVIWRRENPDTRYLRDSK